MSGALSKLLKQSVNQFGSLKNLPTFFDDFNTEELISSYVIQPKISGSAEKSVAREELAKRLITDDQFQKQSNKTLDEKGFKDTIPIYRIITNKPETMNIGNEQLVSGLIDKNKIFKLHDYLTEGKSSMYDDSFLLKYDVPRNRIVGYLPAYGDKINRNVNKKIKERGIGQEKISGFDTVTNPAKFTKGMLEAQDEIIADVSGLKPNILKTEGFSDNKPVNLKSSNSRFINEIVQGNIKNPKDLQNYAGNFSFSKNVKSLADILPVTKDPNAQRYIDEVKSFFDMNGFGALSGLEEGT